MLCWGHNSYTTMLVEAVLTRIAMAGSFCLTAT